MTVQVLDSTDLTGILADAGVTLDPPADDPEASPQSAPAEVQGEGEQPHAQANPDDDEDENGLTAEQRQELTAKMQKAIGKKHRALREAEEFAAAQYNTAQLAQRRAQELEAELAKLRGSKPQQQEQTQQAPAKPDRKDFATESEYIDAMIQFGVDQRLAAQREQQAKEEAERKMQEIRDAAVARIEKARELVPDFDDVVGDVDLEVPPAVAGYMQRSDMFAELGYHFAKNPDVLVSLAKLPPDEQLVKIGKIESTLQPFAPAKAQNDTQSSTQQSNGKPTTAPSETTGAAPSKARGNAAPVITPLDGAGSAGHQKDPADMNIRETIQDWQRKHGTNLSRRQRH